MLDFHSASITIPDTADAATAAIRQALVGASAAYCRLVVFHFTMGHAPDAALRALRAEVPGACVVGCSCAGVIGREGANESMRSRPRPSRATPTRSP